MKTILFHDEVKNINELVDKISEINDAPELNEVKVGVICFLFDKEGKLVFNRRGPGARDDIGKLQALGATPANYLLSLLIPAIIFIVYDLTRIAVMMSKRKA